MLRKLILILSLNLYFINVQAAKINLNCRFRNFPNTSYRIVNGQTALNEYAGITVETGTTTSEGNLQTELDFEREGYVFLFISNTFYKIWLDTGNLTIDQNASGLTFSGSLHWQNYYLYQSKFMQPYLVPGPLKYPKERYMEFIKELNQLQEMRLGLLKTLVIEQKVSKDFYNYMVSETVNGDLLAKNQYALLNEIGQANAPKGYFDFWKNFKVLGDVPIQKNYIDALRDYVDYKVSQVGINSKISRSDLLKKQIFFMDSILKERPITNENVKGN